MKTKIVVILGPTAIGKSDVAVKLAKRFGGEVVSADSRQVYKGLDIGTGKITKRQMRGIRHHLLDVANPKRQFSVAQYATLAKRAIRDILSRGKLPIVCGGTGFYISALLGNETIPDVLPNLALRERLKKKSIAKLFAMLKKRDAGRARRMNSSDRKNPRRLIRAIEIALSKNNAGRQQQADSYLPPAYAGNKVALMQPSRDPYYEPIIIGLELPRNELRKRITIRLFARIREGMIAEAKRLHRQGLSWKRMDELGLEYRYLAKYLNKKISKQELIEKLDTEIWRYAKRQMTWFRRDKKILWFSAPNNKLTKGIYQFVT